MNRKRTYTDEMNATTVPAKTNVLPIRRQTEQTNDNQDQRRRYWPWVQRRLVEMGIYEMAELDAPTRPPGFYVNWTTVTSLIVLVSAIVGLWYFTWQTAEQNGYQRGINEAERQQLLRQIDEAKRDAAEAKKLQTYSAGVADTHDKKEKQK